MSEHKEVEEDIKKYASIAALSGMEGGKILIEQLGSDVVGSIESILSNYRKATHTELVVTVARLEANLSLLRVFKRSKKNKQLAEEELLRLLEE